MTLFFADGKGLADPQKLLQGSGSRVRSIRLQSADDLDRPEVRALIAAATRPHAAVFRVAPKLTTIVKSVAKTRRPRRPREREQATRRNRAGVLAAVAAGNGSPERVLAAAGLVPDDLADPDRMLDAERVLRRSSTPAADELDDDPVSACTSARPTISARSARSPTRC